MITKLWKKITGVEKAEAALAVETARLRSEIAALEVKEAETVKLRLEEAAKKTPKEIATDKKEPWITVLDTHVNKDNIRNGFFELDWNEYFVLQLRTAGYLGETDEAVVGLWFAELCRGIGTEADIPNMQQRGAGYINVNNLGDGKSEVY